jgi:hypothetical protein
MTIYSSGAMGRGGCFARQSSQSTINFCPILRGPVQHERPSARRQAPLYHLKRLQPDHGLERVVLGVKVRRRMVVEEHAGDDAKKLADHRHSIGTPGRLVGAN